MKNEKVTYVHNKKMREPLFHVTKRDTLPFWKAAIVRLSIIIVALVFCGVLNMLLIGANPILIYKTMIEGAFSTQTKFWSFLGEAALLLCYAIAIVPAFRMKFWNLGADGQVLIGCLAGVACMYYLGGKVSDILLIAMMLVASLAASVIWAVLPAIFKAFFNTNESLFTLMLNYISIGIVSYFINKWVKSGSGVLNPIEYGSIPDIFGQHYLFIVIVAAILTAFMFIYLRFSKHGYEVAVVGESKNTARYIGINVKKVVIRTLILSGLICGIIGFVFASSLSHTISADLSGGRGFTAIMVAWLSKFNPIIMVIMSMFIVFLDVGMSWVNTMFGLDNVALSQIVTGIIFFFIIASDFFITYKIVFGTKVKDFFANVFKIFKKKKVNNAEGDNKQ